MTPSRLTLPPAVASAREALRGRWSAMSARERALTAAAIGVVGAFIVWSLLLAPAWRTTREAPAQIDQLDAQLQQMQRLAAESRELRNTPPLAPAQAAMALKASSERLGERAKLTLQGDRAVLTLTNVSGEQLRGWLAEARSAAHAQAVEAQLTRGAQGYSGSIVVSLGGAPQ